MKKNIFPLLFVFLFASIIFLNTSQTWGNFEQQIQILTENKEGLNDSELLHRIFDLSMKWKITSYPEFATFNGYPGQNHRWTDQSLEAIAKRKEAIVLFYDLLMIVEKSRLTQAEQFNYDLFKTNIDIEVEGNRFKTEYMTITQMKGVQIYIPQVIEAMPTSTSEDYENIFSRYRGIPRLIDQTIELLNRGLGERITLPKIILRDVPRQILNLIGEDPLKSRVMYPFHRFPDTIPAAARDQLKNEAIEIFTKEIVPAFRKLHDYLITTYIQQTRETIGMSVLPNGTDWYKFKNYQYTTIRLSPEDIHKVGLSEIKRIQQEMEGIIEKIRFKGSFSDFIQFLQSNPQFFFEETDNLLIAYRDIAKRADPALTNLFGNLPRLPYGIKPVPAYKEKSQPTAYYEPGSYRMHRPGYFFANTYNLRSRPKWEMEVLTLHEAVPGHHLQISLEQELENVPEFRKYTHYTAFTEGWGLYAESLGEKMGFYQNVYSKFGQLTYEIWRAVRLVVDTGIHAKGWSRQEAIDFFKKHTAKTDHDTIIEIDRYIAMPGQALSYKIGELKIKELCSYSKKELGDAFDIRAFHDALLGSGSLPLEILETNMREWVENRKND